MQHGIGFAGVRHTAFPCSGPSLLAAFAMVRVMDARNGLEQALAIGGRQDVDDAGIRGDSFKQNGGGVQLLQQVGVGLWRRGGGVLAHLRIFNGD